MNKRNAILCALLACMMPVLVSCGTKSLKDIKMTSCNVSSFTPKGLTSFDATVDLGVDNPSVQFALSKMYAVVKMNGSPCIHLTADDVTIAPRTEQVYPLTLHGTMDGGFNPFSLLGLLEGSGLEQMTIDVKYHGALKSGLGKDFEYKDIPLTDLIDRL